MRLSAGRQHSAAVIFSVLDARNAVAGCASQCASAKKNFTCVLTASFVVISVRSANMCGGRSDYDPTGNTLGASRDAARIVAIDVGSASLE
jgi:hypothetical protein